MAGMGRYPKDESSRRNRAERQFDWASLPLEGRGGDAPPLPDLRPWTEPTRDWWAALWATPQAVMWDQSGRTLHTLAILHHQLTLDQTLEAEKSKASSISAEMRQHEDRHGLTPKAMLQLRWRVSTTPADDAGKVLHLVPAGVAPVDLPDKEHVPAKRAKKAVWVEWATRFGMETSTAEKLSKAQLIERFSSVPTESPVPAQRPPSAAANRLRDMASKRKR